jgi:hypothetical protein
MDALFGPLLSWLMSTPRRPGFPADRCNTRGAALSIAGAGFAVREFDSAELWPLIAAVLVAALFFIGMLVPWGGRADLMQSRAQGMDRDESSFSAAAVLVVSDLIRPRLGRAAQTS